MIPKIRWRLIGGLILVAIFLVLALPDALSAYHLQAGGQALERALGRHEALDWWYVGPREVRDPQALQTAIAHLERANPAPYAQRLLGQAYVAQGNALGGVQALEQFVERRPKHYLAQLELAAAYVYADARLHQLEYLDMLDHLNGGSVSAPDLAGQTRYSAEEWRSEYVYPTAYSLPPEYGDRPTLFVHAGSQVTWTVALLGPSGLTEPSVLRFGMGQAPHSLDWGGDGATFEVLIDGERLFLEHLPPEQARQGWHEREVDLAPYMGQTIRLSLATTAGPTGDVTGDWAGWGEPRLEAAAAAAYRETVKRQPWRAKWNELGVQAEDWIEAGEVARKAEQYETALTWYEWAERVAPGRGDVWYYRGLIYERQGQWERALIAHERAIKLDRLQLAHASSPYYHAGMIYQWRLESRQVDKALSAYESAIDKDDHRSEWEAADSHYRRGELLYGLKRDADQYISEFRQAIEIYPQHSGAHALLGRSIYERDKDLISAEAELLLALELAPQDKWSHYQLGRIYEQEGQREQAEQMYVRATAIDPDFAAARERLEDLRTR